MLLHRPAAERGQADFGWLDSRHTFSFGDYHDPAWMGFRGLRVINDDRIAEGGGFPTHPHRDMEIITWIVAGALAHRDSMGHQEVIRPGDAQRMTAGTGIHHSEFNAHPGTTRLLQIWLLPSRRNLTPGYAQTHFPLPERQGRLRRIAVREGTTSNDGAITLHADADLLTGIFLAGESARVDLTPGRHGWIQVVSGGFTVNGQALVEGDGLGLSGEPVIDLTATAPGEVLVFDLG